MATHLLKLLNLAERLGNLAQARLKAIGAEHGLQPVHVQALLYLAAANRYSNTPQAVAEYLGLTKGTVSQSLILLEEKGFLTRGSDGRDRRVVRLSLSPAGNALVGAVGKWGLAGFRAAADALGDAPLTAMTELLRRLQMEDGRRSFGVCATCRHHLAEGRDAWRCGLTGEPLSRRDREMICREHEPV